MNKTFNPKIIYLLICFLLSLLISNQYLVKFENNSFKSGDQEYSSIFQEDSLSYITEAEKIRTDINSGKNFFESGGAYKFSFLYPRIIYFFNKMINDNVIMASEYKIELKNYKLFIFFQISIFLLSLIFLYKVISKILEKGLSLLIVSVLFINPIIFQWHLAFLTESLFLSALIFSICVLLNSKNFFHFFLLGVLIGVLYMLRTIALLYPIVLIFYLLFQKKNISQKILNSLSLISGLFLILLFIGMQNYKRAGVFYFTPLQSKTDLKTYIEPTILIKSKKFTELQAREYLNKKSKIILDNNNFDLTKESEKIQFYNEIQSNSIKTITDNKIIFFKIILKKYAHSLLLNPNQVYFAAKYKTWYEFKNSPEHKFWLKVRFVITPIFFSLFILGLIFSLRKINFKINTLLFFSILYFFFTSCWLGNTRYFIPSIMFMSIYFSLALNKIYELITTKKLN